MIDQREATEAVRQILSQLFQLTDRGFPSPRISRICRETIYFIYERSKLPKFDFDRPHSARARALHCEARLANRRFNSQKYPIVYDHSIPLKTLGPGLRSTINSPEQFSAFLAQHVKGVVLLKEEDTLLNAYKLRSRMPAGARPDDPLARYRAAGIEFEPDDIAKFG